MFTFVNKPQNILSTFLDSHHLYKVSLRSIWRWQLLWLLPMVASEPLAAGTNMATDLRGRRPELSRWLVMPQGS